MGPCPDPETLAAFLEHQLFPEERERIEEHLARCSRCVGVLADSMSYLETQLPPRTEAPSGRRAFAAIVAVLVAATAIAGAWLALRDGDARAGGRARSALYAALGDRRASTARLTGGMPWSPPGDVLRGATMGPEDWRLAAAAENARVLADASASGPALGALGAAHLLLGDTDAAIATMVRATAATPGDAALRSDLAAALVDRARATGAAADYAEALENATAAVKLDSSLGEARYNRALALEGLGLRATALAAWRTILTGEKDAGWAAEARQHVARLDSAVAAESQDAAEQDLRARMTGGEGDIDELVARRPNVALGLVRDVLLPEWSRAVLAGDTAAATRAATTADRLAGAFARATGDRALAASTERLASGSAGDRRRLAEGHLALVAGTAARDDMKIAQARELLGRARVALQEDPRGQRRTRLELVACDYYDVAARSTVGPAMDRLLAEARAAGDLDAAARAAWMRGLVAGSAGEVGPALAVLQASLEDFARLGDADHAAWIHHLIGNAYGATGDERRAWSERATALQDATTPLTRNKVLADAAAASLLERRPYTSLALLDELAASPQTPADWLAASAAVWRLRARQELGLGSAAELQSALVAVARVEAEADRRWILPELQMARGLLADDPRVAVHAFGRALAGYDKIGRQLAAPAALLGRGRAHLALGETQLAEQDFRRGIVVLEQRAAGLGSDALWMRPTELAADLYGRTAGLLLARGDEDGAFELLERGRARALRATLGGLSSEAATAGSPRAIARHLDADTTLLVFATIGERRILWRIDAQGSRWVELEAEPNTVDRLAAQLRADLQAGAWSASSRRGAAELYRALIAPARLDDDRRRLVIVPDAGLAALPFAALVEPTSDRYLVERTAVETAPSVSVYLDARQRARAIPAAVQTALVVGDARASARFFPTLPALPGAADEARRVAQLYPRSTLALGAQATRQSFLDAAGHYAVLHVAGHALVSDADPSRSSLLLAPAGPEDTGALTAADIARLRLDGTRAVVLAGCDTAAGPVAGAEGTLSLGRAFLAARVPTVVASLWPLRDRASVELLTSLHATLLAGSSPAESLRAAQLQMIHSSDPLLRSPAIWAAFQAIGG